MSAVKSIQIIKGVHTAVSLSLGTMHIIQIYIFENEHKFKERVHIIVAQHTFFIWPNFIESECVPGCARSHIAATVKGLTRAEAAE